MVIAAQWDEQRNQQAARADGRRGVRRTLRLEAVGELAGGQAARVLVHNVSATGLLIESETRLGAGETLSVDLPEAGLVQARVVWSSGTLYGCEFEAPVRPAVLSAAQLRSAVVDPVAISAPRGLTDESFGERLHRLRKLRGLSMAQIAATLEVSKPTVWAWEQDKARPIAARIDALAQVLQVPSWELMAQRDPDQRRGLLDASREKIAQAFGIAPDMVRILIEL